MKNNYSNIFTILIALCFTTLLSCTSDNNSGCKEIPSLFNGKEITPELLNKYLIATSSFANENIDLSEEIRIYVDKSSGINEAFSSALGGVKAKSLLLEIAGQNNLKYYGVLSDIKPEVFQGSPTNYYDKKENYHPTESASLEKALKEITNYNGLSFFVTDGEEFDPLGEEDNARPWAEASMEKWIKQGNSIHFWITDFEVASMNKGPKNIRKYLFFMAFVPAELNDKEQFQNLL
jgi:hypothetical protein